MADDDSLAAAELPVEPAGRQRDAVLVVAAKGRELRELGGLPVTLRAHLERDVRFLDLDRRRLHQPIVEDFHHRGTAGPRHGDDAVVRSGGVDDQGRSAEQLVDRTPNHVDVLDAHERHNGVGVEQPATDDAQQAAVDGVAEPAVNAVRGDEDAA